MHFYGEKLYLWPETGIRGHNQPPGGRLKCTGGLKFNRGSPAMVQPLPVNAHHASQCVSNINLFSELIHEIVTIYIFTSYLGHSQGHI